LEDWESVMAATLSFNQIRAEVAALGRKKAVERPVGIRAPGQWLGEPVQSEGDTAYLIRQCDSPLAMRLALREKAPTDKPHAVKVIVTNLDDDEISGDIFARLHRQRFFSIDRWSLVQQQFAADSIDPQLVQHDWLADAVVEYLGGRRPVAVKSGCLSADTLWRELLIASIGLTADVPDLPAVLRWSLEGANIRRYRDLPEHLRTATREWVCRRAGAATDFVFAAAEHAEAPDAVPLALAAGVLVAPETRGKADRSLGMLEAAHLARRRWPAELLARVAGEAASLVRAGMADPAEQRRILTRAEELLRDLDATEFAQASPLLPLGLTQRLGTFAAAVRDFASGGGTDLGVVVTAADLVRSHDQTHARPSEQDRLAMAMRLARWLAWRRASAVEPQSLAEAANDYLETGSFVDWARDTIGRVAETRELSDAVATLQAAATQEQENLAEAFARLLQNTIAAGSLSDGLVGIENLLDELIVPLARQMPVLLVVLDGMSAAVCRELVDALTTDLPWRPIVEQGRATVRPVLATIPSETRYSRASLLAGKLVTGGIDEATAFAAHPGLAGVSAANRPPLLYAKGDIKGNDLPTNVRDEIASPSRRVVGVIVNAVDDHLGKADQLTVRWTLESLELLRALLYEARTAGRAVVLTSDHGHVLDRGSKARVSSDGGARWRPAGSGPPAADELAFRGARVLIPGGELVTTWSEGVRYIATANRGYHGGVNPQEMVVPVAVLIPADEPTEPAGWQAAPEATPPWWDEIGDPAPHAAAPTAEPKTPEPRPTPSGLLFDKNREEPPPARSRPAAATAPAPAPAPEWIDQLFLTEVFTAQRKLVSRGYSGDELFKRLLAELDSRGGRMTRPALSRALSYPPFRLGGLLSQAQRLFNVDGYPVVTVDDESDTIVFARRTLLVQFGLSEAGEGAA
jgi:hypothetical protein